MDNNRTVRVNLTAFGCLVLAFAVSLAIALPFYLLFVLLPQVTG